MASVTQTETLPRETTLRMDLQPSLEMRINTLLRLLSNSNFWSSGTWERVNKWKTRWLAEFAPKLQTEEGAQKASLVLCYLLVHMVRPEIKSQTGHHAVQIELARCEQAAREVLQILLPKDVDPVRFITQFAAGENARKIEELHAKLRVESFQKLSCIQQEKFQELKTKLLELNTNRKNMKAELQARVEAITLEILKLCDTLKKLSDDVLQNAEMLRRYEAQFQAIMQECERLCLEVQRL